jgi:sugar phosphate isomerase/epimerase
MKFAICQELYEGWDWERQCRFSAELGYQGLEVAPFTLAERITDVSPEKRAEMRRQAEEAGVEIIGLHWLLAKTEGFHLTTRDGAVRAATAEYLKELGRACAEMGGSVLVFGSPAQRNLEEGMAREEAYANAADVFRACMPAIGAEGVKLCMEPLTAKETDFVNTCADAVELIRLVDHPNFVLHQDVKAMLGAETEPLPQVIEKYAPYVGHFHVNDTNLLGPGMGETDFAPIFAALARTKYAGWVSVEVFDYSPGCEHIARASIEYMRKIARELES